MKKHAIISLAESVSDIRELETRYLDEIDENAPDEEALIRLDTAIKAGKITFFVAKIGGTPVGMCSVSRCFSTFACSDVAQFEDFFILPEYRHGGIARELTEAAQKWCRDNGIPSLTVTSSPSDEAMYQHLGFTLRLGTTYANVIE